MYAYAEVIFELNQTFKIEGKNPMFKYNFI